jgi:hypothetical protein
LTLELDFGAPGHRSTPLGPWRFHFGAVGEAKQDH